jgi:hypothetical protein
MFQLSNPIPQFTEDKENLRNFYRDFNLVPYAGSSTGTAHNFLRLLFGMYDLCPSHATCIENIAFWSFQGDLDFTERKTEGLKIEEEEENGLSLEEKIGLAESLKELGLSLPTIREKSRRLFVSDAVCGDRWLNIRIASQGDQVRASVDFLHPRKVMYLNTKPGEDRSVIISEDFFNLGGFRKEYPPRVVAEYPNFSQNGEVLETVLHWKHERDHGTWYGKPKTLQVLHWMFTEWQTSNMHSKIAGSDLLSKALIVMEGPDPNAGEEAKRAFYDISDEIREVLSNKGTHKTATGIGVSEYPKNSQAPEVLKLDINRDYRYLDSISELASNHIYSAHNWSKILSSYARAASGIGGNVLIDEFITKNASVIRPTQDEYESLWKKVFNILGEVTGKHELLEVGIRFEDKVQAAVESLKEARGDGNNHNEIGSLEIQPPGEKDFPGSVE